MGCCLATAATTTTCCLCRLCTSCGKMSEKCARWVYVAMMVVASIVALLLKFFGGHIFINLYAFKASCGPDTIKKAGAIQAACAGNSAVYRISLGMVVFFLAIAIASAACKQFHTGWWILKVPVYLVCLVFPFFVPDVFFHGYQQMARVMSGFYLLLQILFLINFAHEIHEWILDKSDEYQDEADEGREKCAKCDCWRALYLVLSFGGIVGIVTAIAFMYVYFDCFIGKFMPSVTLVLAFVVILMSLMSKFNKGLLTGVVVAGYSTYLCWNGLVSNPDQFYSTIDQQNITCNPFICDPQQDSSNACNPGTMVVGIIFAACGLAYAGMRAGGNAGQALGVTKDDEDGETKQGKLSESRMGKKLRDEDQLEEALTQEKPKRKGYQAVHDDELEDASSDEESYDENVRCCGIKCTKCSFCSRFLFHFMMHLACWYMAMLLTNWAENNEKVSMQTGKTSMWVQFVSQWVSVALFIWTCVAAFCCTNRDFD